MGGSKGKTTAALARQDAQEGVEFGPALVGARITAAALDKIQHLVAGKHNEHGASAILPARTGRFPTGYYPIFLHTLFAGLVPPYSPFLEAVLEFYQVHLLHLHPNAILVLSIFAFLCEAYLGVKPSIALFRSFYALRNTAKKERTGCVSFRIADGMGDVYIPMAWNGDRPVTAVSKKVEDFRQKWFLIRVPSESSLLEVPEAPPVKNTHWSKRSLEGQAIADLVGHLRALREHGLTGQLVAAEFVRRRIAPLQAHKKPMWAYTGPTDPLRLHLSDHRPAVVETILGGLFVNPEVPARVHVAIRPLFEVPDKRRATLAQAPAFTPLGLAGDEEEEEPMPADTTESPSASDSEQGDAETRVEPSAGVGSSAGAGSSSGVAPPAGEVQELSSGDSEEAAAGRHEPRTKAAHDRPAGEPPSAPHKRKAEEALEAGARAVPSWRSPGMTWVDTRAKKTR